MREVIIDKCGKSEILDKLGFQLTTSQSEVIEDIEKDFQSPYRMIRMLQGDVGSGKTHIRQT